MLLKALGRLCSLQTCIQSSNKIASAGERRVKYNPKKKKNPNKKGGHEKRHQKFTYCVNLNKKSHRPVSVQRSDSIAKGKQYCLQSMNRMALRGAFLSTMQDHGKLTRSSVQLLFPFGCCSHEFRTPRRV